MLQKLPATTALPLELLREAEALRDDAVQVDQFSQDDYMKKSVQEFSDKLKQTK